MKDLIIINEVVPVIDCNFEEVKKDLQLRLDDYKKLVVTEDSLTFCKNEQRHLAGLRKKIEDYRKKTKNEMSKPIKTFEDKCKEIVQLIADTETPIKEGIQVFDTKRKDAKKDFAISEIKRVIEDLNLNTKFASQMLFNDRYMLLSVKEKEVAAHIEEQGKTLILKQNRELEVIETVESTIIRVNSNIVNKLKLSDFSFIIDSDNSISEIIEIVEQKAEKVKEDEERTKQALEQQLKNKLESESKKKEEELRLKIETELKEKEISKEKVIPEVINNEKIYTYNMKLTGSSINLKLLKEFMSNNNIAYELI